MRKSYKKILIMIVICTLVLSGCSIGEKKQSKKIISGFLEAYQQRDKECGKYLFSNGINENVEFEGFQSVLANHITFQIESVEINKKYNIVNVVITNVDFKTVFESLLNENLKVNSTEEIKIELEKRLLADDAPMREFKVPIKLNEEKKIEMTSELSNALLGGYTQYIYELTEGGV